MTGFLSQFDGTVHLDAMTGEEVDGSADLPEWWVEVKKTLPQGDFERAQRFLLGDMGVTATNEDDAVMKQTSDMIGYQRELAIVGIVAWNLTDDHEDRLPYSNREDRERSLAKLPPYLVTAIHTTVAKYNQPRRPAETTRFRDDAPAGDPIRVGGATESSEVRDGASALETAGA